MEKTTVISKIKDLLANTIDLHDIVSLKWQTYAKEQDIQIFNQKAMRVSKIDDNGLIDTVIEYDRYLTNLEELRIFSEFDCPGFIVNTRIKAQNSILDKLDDYCTYSDHKGEVPVNKCFNDLFGIRIITDCQDLTYDDIEQCVRPYDCLSIEDKSFSKGVSKANYIAVHIYFKGKGPNEERNKKFRWELQIWTKQQEANNQKLHLKHRFKYRDWESEVSRDDSTQDNPK